MTAVRESTVEAYFCAQVLAAGGLRRKLEWVGRPHAPDQLTVMPGTGTVLVELKRPGKAPRDGQEREHGRLRAHGARVDVISTFEEVEAFIERNTGMSDDQIVDRLRTGESMFEKALLAYILRLLADRRDLMAHVAKLENK